MDGRLLKLRLRGSSCDNCRFQLEHRKYSENLDWCYSHEKQPPQSVCMLWEEPTLEDEFTKATNKLLEQRRRAIKVKVQKPTRAELERWYDWSTLGKVKR